MKSPVQKQSGMVAILDAIGAASYTDPEITEFMKSRSSVLTLLNEKIDGESPSIHGHEVHIFTFNDTIVIVYATGHVAPGLRQINSFFRILRKFLVDSLVKRIMFRGSLAIGTFFVDDETNTVMGQAVTDAAAWYDKAEWLGIQATPRTSLLIDRCLAQGEDEARHLMFDYEVPLKTGKTVRVKAVNWPRVFHIERITPCEDGESPRGKFLQLLADHPVPLGTEQKYFNTLAFFDAGSTEGSPKKKPKVKRPGSMKAPQS